MSPIYVYVCDACNTEQEEIFSVANRPPSVACKRCGKEAKNAMASGNFIVNGANAANGYRGDSNFRWIGGKDDK